MRRSSREKQEKGNSPINRQSSEERGWQDGEKGRWRKEDRTWREGKVVEAFSLDSDTGGMQDGKGEKGELIVMSCSHTGSIFLIRKIPVILFGDRDMRVFLVAPDQSCE